MAIEMRYGDGQTLRLELPAESIVADASVPRGIPLEDPASAVVAALSEPFDFPAFAQAVVPGDRIALAVERGIPQVSSVIAGAVHAVLDAGANVADISLVLDPGIGPECANQATSQLSDEVRTSLDVSIHDPDEADDCSYLAASKDGHPIYFNRRVYDADVVLPITTLRLPQSLGYAGIFSGLYPTLSDNATRRRFRAPTTADWSVHQRRRREEADEAAWLLGIQCSLHITPGPSNSVLDALAGSAEAVATRGTQRCEAAWLHRTTGRASLVLATIDGGSEQQSWDNFARALFSASNAVTDGGAIVICTSLCRAPGPALMQLAAAADADREVQRSLRRERSEDAISATLLADTQQRAQVYLLSGLDSGVVEDLGLGHVSDCDEIRRLCQQHASCILLGSAQFAMVAADEE